MEPTQCNKIGNACIRIWSQKPSKGIKIGDECNKIGNNIQYCLRKKE